jgi:hypothetical protein
LPVLNDIASAVLFVSDARRTAGVALARAGAREGALSVFRAAERAAVGFPERFGADFFLVMGDSRRGWIQIAARCRPAGIELHEALLRLNRVGLLHSTTTHDLARIRIAVSGFDR